MNDLTNPTSSTSEAAVPIAWVEHLFGQLTAIVGAGIFTSVYAGADPDAVKAQWAEGLAGFSVDEIKRGIAATRTRKFPPNLPEFLHLCRPSLDGEIAWSEAEAGLKAHADHQLFAWSHPAVYWAARAMQHEVRTIPFGQVRKRWDVLLAAEFAKGAWASPPDPRIKRLASPEERQAAIPGTDRHVQMQARLQELRKKMTGFATREEERAARKDPGWDQLLPNDREVRS